MRKPNISQTLLTDRHQQPTTRDPETVKKVIGCQHVTNLTHVGEPPVLEARQPSSISPQTTSQWTAPTPLAAPAAFVASSHVTASSPSQSTPHVLVAPTASPPVASPTPPALTAPFMDDHDVGTKWTVCRCCTSHSGTSMAVAFSTWHRWNGRLPTVYPRVSGNLRCVTLSSFGTR